MVVIKEHIVAYTVQAWGHARPLINLGARMVKLRPVQVTFLTTNGFFERAKNELARSFEEGDSEYAQRIRIISIGEVQDMKLEDDNVLFNAAWKTLVNEGELVCVQTGIRYTSLPKPQTAIMDFFAVDPINLIKATSGDAVKVFGWEPGLAYALFHLFGPKKLGGKGNIRIKAEEEAKRTGRSYQEVALQLSGKPTGQVVHIPAMPPMYDYEYYPQDFPLPEEIGISLFPRVYETIETKMDGLFLLTPEDYEPDAVAATRAWLGETGRPVYACGPLLPSASKETAIVNEKKQSKESNEIDQFLDATLQSSGEKSLLYISFGSVFWPVKSPEKLWAFLDVVMELNIPFILSHASPLAVITDEVKEKVKAYGKGVLSPWSPQQLILEHPATGWFLAHGGHNGVTEAICAGVPQILWPFGGDQPLNAVHIADTLQAGYELLEIRTGHGLKPIYRTGRAPIGTIDALKAEAREVLSNAFGDDGTKKRVRLEELRKAVISAWEDGGASKRDVMTFLDCL